ncbi:filamentous haemagglutinin family protein [Thiobacillus denitrificans]|uniref:Filamentous hemagglutinin n=1 Tax=Thiobacillus denitrificans TaxID=36861 RepID=A0A106BMC5_THIDE|nr:filamentous haemagglutinin family protein [Thiobacillus denitrificans]KVW95123.1 filamentous hemagglutinin [Thiobacillus denitrificans]
MNRNRYRLVFNTTLGMMVPVAETARRSGKSSQGKAASGSALALAGALLAGAVQAELPAQVTGAGFATTNNASYQTNGAQAYVNQVGNKSILNWQSFNVGAGHDVQFRQVDSLATNNLVQGANFTSLNRIHDINPSIIAGSISQAAGQKANVILVNSNGIAFMGGSQVNLNGFTASTLNIDDSFIFDGFLRQGSTLPQFEKALDGGAARGFIKVFEGAQITAGSQGRVMLIAPTVVNKGKVAAGADGQVIAAAASRVYLRAAGGELNGLLIEVDSPANVDAPNPELDDQTVSLVDAAENRLGHVTNLGELSAARGNVTMVGYAVNQMGIARATTSVVSNGSVYLLAKDTAVDLATQTPGSARAGRVVLGENSLTEILPEVADTATTQDGAAGTALDKPSRVRIVGQDIRIEGAARDTVGNPIPGTGAQIVVPAGEVELIALDNPQGDFFNGGATDMFSGDVAASTVARVHIGSGARIDVAGLRDVEVAAGRGVVEIDLRGDELKDSPVNQQGPLRGQKVFLDVDRALAESDAGKPTLIARDTLLNLKAQQQRTVAERSTVGGTVKIYSKGEAIIENGVEIDLSGGSLKHAAGNIKTTLLTANGKTADLSEASAEVRYNGIATRFVRRFERWNREEVIDLGQSFRFDSGFDEGRDAGRLETFGIDGLFARPDIAGNTVTGARQRDLGIQPAGARWTVGFDDVSSIDKNKVEVGGYTTQDFKLNQAVALSSSSVALPEGFRFGDALPAELKSNLALDSRTLGENRVAELTVLNNQAIAVRDALQAPRGGGVSLTGANIEIAADIAAQSGTIALVARNTAGQLADALPIPRLTVADGVKLSAGGAWVNDQPGVGARTADAPLIDGGTISLAAESVSNGPGSFVARGELELGRGVTLDADSGAWRKPDGTLAAGDGGAIALRGFTLRGLDDADVHAYGVGKGGALTLGAGAIQVGGATAAPDTLELDSGLFERGGFARYALNALTRLDVAENAVIAPVLLSRELRPDAVVHASGSDIAAFSDLVVREPRLRQAVDVMLTARQNTEQTGEGEVTIGRGASIELDPRAKLVLDGLNRVDIDGLLRAQGGAITATSDFAVRLGDTAALDVSGVARTYLDSRSLTQGEVLAGGTVDIVAASVTTMAGSQVDVSGAAPVRLDVPNEKGGLGRAAGSDAGTFRVFADGIVQLDGALAAHAGDRERRGGVFEVTLGEFDDPGLGQALPPTVLHLAPSVTPGATDGVTRLDAGRIERAGFDRVRLASRDAIMLDDGIDVGAGRAQPLRELTLDAAAILTGGGDSALAADTLRLGNLDPIRRAASTATTQSGTLKLDAQLLELAGKFELGGMARTELTGREEIRLSGVTAGTALPVGELRSAADLAFHGAVVAPASYARTRIVAPGKTISFTRSTDAPVQPLSALGSLTVEAANIVQDGNLWAPLGQFDFQASDSLVFANGSLTSVAATPGSLLPFGKLQNGRDWVVDLDSNKVPDGQIAVPELNDKAIRVSGQTVDMQPGAKVNLAGGGDLQGYEFTVGPGGSRDILADKNTYAILPGYQGGFAPTDAQEGFDRASGEAVFLSGVTGLADGMYTLLPAHYALLPGAYAVKLDTSIKDVLPGQAYSRQDGVRIAAGYVTDTRAGAPKDARWQGVQVLTHEQVRARSEFTLTRASDFFAGSRNRPQDAGLMSVATTGSGTDALKLDAIYKLAAGQGGRGAQVDISALKLAVTSGTPAGIDLDAVVLDADKLNALGADSLFIGGMRSASGDTTTLAVGANEVTLANDADHVLKAGEIILAANDTLTLESGSAIDAQGETGDAGHYETAGNGALVRAASTSATFARTGSPDRSQGTLVGEAALVDEAGSTIKVASLIKAADSITLDATKENAYKGAATFNKNGAAVAGNLAVGATRINFGKAPVTAEGITYSQGELNAFDSLKGLTLISYTTFDLYSGETVGGIVRGVKVGGIVSNKPTLQNLTLQGAGLAGIDNAGQTAQINAKNLTLSNPSNAASFTPGGTLGNGNLAVTADTLTLGAGNKKIQGFSAVSVTANELVGRGAGETDIFADTSLHVARISGERNADQTLDAVGKLEATEIQPDRELLAVNALGAKWAMAGTEVMFDTLATLPSGYFKLTETNTTTTVTTTTKPTPVPAPTPTITTETSTTSNWSMETETEIKNDATSKITTTKITETTTATPSGIGKVVKLGGNAKVDVTGRTVQFFDVTEPSWGGTAEFASDSGNVEFAAGSNVDVSAAAGGDAGTLIVRAANGSFTLADGSVSGAAPMDADNTRGEGARALIDTGTLASFSTLNSVLNSGGFDGERGLRVRSGNVDIAAGDMVVARDIRISADGGTLDVAGTLDASGDVAGRIELFARDDVNVLASARLKAISSGALEDGGDIEIGTRDGSLDLAADSAIDVSGGAGGQGGTVLLRASRTANDVKIGALGGSIDGARSVAVEAVRVYNPGDIGTLDTGTDALTLTAASLETIKADNTAFAGNHANIASRLAQSAKPAFHILSGVEVRSAGALTLGQDWNLSTARANGEAGVLTLRADGDLNLNANLSDGFSVATPFSAGTTPATLRTDDSWSYRLIGGADGTAANPLAVRRDAGDVKLAAGKLVRTGTGDIRIAAGRDIELADGTAAIYTAGRAADAAAGFVLPFTNLRAAFSQDGGDVSLVALRDVRGKPSAQLYSQWLYRQGAIDPVTGLYVQQPAWWVRFDQFQQGVGALGGGDVRIAAGGMVKDVSASAPTQARTTGASPADAVRVETGGGDVRIMAGQDVLGGSYYASRGELVVQAGGQITASDQGINFNAQPLATMLAIGDARTRVRAQGDVTLANVLNPHLVPQSAGNLVQPPFFGPGLKNRRATLFSTYGADSGVEVSSLSGKVSLPNAGLRTSAFPDLLGGSLVGTQTALASSLLPPTLSVVAFTGDVAISSPASGDLTLSPSANGTLSVLAGGSVQLDGNLSLSDMDPQFVPDALRPSGNLVLGPQGVVISPQALVPPVLINPFSTLGNIHAATPVHAADRTPARVYANTGDVVGINAPGQGKVLNVSKAVSIRAGGDVRDLTVHAQHNDASDVSRVEAGRDVTFDSTSDRRDRSQIRIGGGGRLEVVAGRDIDLGTSGGIVSRGNVDNANLAPGGADIRLAAGVGANGIDYAGAVDRLIAKLEAGAPDDVTLWQARWLTGDGTLAASDALAAVRGVDAQGTDMQQESVRAMLFTALRETGRDANKADSGFAGDFSRGYAALELIFPGIEAKNPEGGFSQFDGTINLFASRVKTENGGNIEFFAPGGDVIVGLPNTPAALVNVGNDVLGMVVAGAGDIKGFSRGDMLVNQSRILTVAGGDVLLWSSEGDIDAGKGKKTAAAVPPPIIRVDAQGNVTLEQQGAVTGSGIGALFVAGGTAGDVDLIAPKGTVNAGDAGIRAGNLNIAAQVVLGADNISVSGTSAGTPIADTSAVTAASSGASNAGGDVSSTTAALSQNLADAARAAEELKQAFKPTFITAEVIGHGE